MITKLYSEKVIIINRFDTVKKAIYYLKKTGFRSFEFFQTIFHALREIDDLEPIKEGYDEGSFVVIKATK